MANRTPFSREEWYHCYNRGVDKRKIFLNLRDYERFTLLLYVCNGTERTHLSNLRDPSSKTILANPSFSRGEPIVEIGAYCLMPNHIHLILKEKSDGGIALFMQRLFTGYTMYFNKRHERTGALFSGTFKSKHLYDDRYLKRVISYVHLNPAELFEHGWKQGNADLPRLEKNLLKYAYSSLPDFSGIRRPEHKILGTDIFELFESRPPFKEMLADAQAYYEESAISSVR